jgi:hypothetical protein
LRFSKQSAHKVARQTRYIERRPKNLNNYWAARRPVILGNVVMNARITQDVQPSTYGTQPGYGKGILQQITLPDDPSMGGNYGFGDDKTLGDPDTGEVWIYNFTDKLISSPCYGLVCWMYGGWFWFCPDSCGHVSGGSV